MSDAIRCDGCGAFADRPHPWGGYQYADGRKHWGPHDAPDGWVRLDAVEHPYSMAVVSDCRGEFCGWPCAARWLNNYVATRTTRESV